MTATTYASLQSDIASYCERSDSPFIDQIPRFISLAESRISMENKPLGFLRMVTGNLNGGLLVKPTRWRRTRSFSITVNGTERQYLFLRTYEYCRNFWSDINAQGAPRYYADYDYEHFFISPTPDAVYP
jgi:hypothetical protein